MRLPLVMCISLGLSGAAFAESFEYRISRYTVNERGSNCFDEIEAVAARMEAIAGTKVTFATCEVTSISTESLDGVIGYEADERLSLVRYAQYGNMGVEDTALYDTAEACQADIERQESLFTAETGLMPHVAFCYGGPRTFNPRWRLQMEAVGATERQHWFSGMSIYKEPAHGYDSLLEQVKDSFQARGIALSVIGYASTGVGRRLTIGVYGESDLNLNLDYSVRIDDAGECEAYLSRASAGFASLDNPPVAIYCDKAPAGYSGIHLNIVSVGDNATEPNGYRQITSPGFYQTLDECRADRGTQVARHSRRNQRVIEAFCGYNIDRKIVLQLFFGL